MDFYHYKVVVYTHCQNKFPFKQLVKVHVALYDPLSVLSHLPHLVRLNRTRVVYFLPLVRTKASELSDFPGVNTFHTFVFT